MNTIKERDLKLGLNQFAHACVKLAISLPMNKLGNHIRKQLIRCATSTAAYYRPSLGQTKKSFISKLNIVIQEADECIFWIEFLAEEKLSTETNYRLILKDATELTPIFITSCRTAEKSVTRGEN